MQAPLNRRHIIALVRVETDVVIHPLGLLLIGSSLKKAGYDVSDRIHLRYEGGEFTQQVFNAQGDLVAAETLAVAVDAGEADWPDATEVELGGETVRLWVRRESD